MTFFARLFSFDCAETKGEFLFYRIFEAIIIYQIIFYAWEWALYIPRLGEVILPLGMANYIDVSFMFSGPYSLINAALVSIFALLGFLKKGRYFYLLAVLCMHLQYIARYSQGEISHGSNFTATALVTFAVAAIFISHRLKRRKVAFGLFIFLIGMGYTSAGLSKLIGTGLSWVDGRHLYLWIGERATDKLSQNGAFQLNFFQELLLDQLWLATTILTIGVLSELFGFLLWFRKTRWVQATILIGMHFGIYISMSINFRAYFIILLIVGYPWARFFDYLLNKNPNSSLNAFLARPKAAPS